MQGTTGGEGEIVSVQEAQDPLAYYKDRSDSDLEDNHGPFIDVPRFGGLGAWVVTPRGPVVVTSHRLGSDQLLAIAHALSIQPW